MLQRSDIVASPVSLFIYESDDIAMLKYSS